MSLGGIPELRTAMVDALAPRAMAPAALAATAASWCPRGGRRKMPGFQRLIDRHRPDLLAFVRARVRAPIDAADIVQEVWTQALPAFEAGRVDQEKAYLYAIARNIAAEAMRQHYRRSRWFVETPGEAGVADEAPSAYRVANAKNQLQTLEEAVGGLPDRCREVFELRHVQQLGKVEIADRLGITTKQVEKQLREALARCRRVLIGKNNLHDDGSKPLPSPT